MQFVKSLNDRIPGRVENSHQRAPRLGDRKGIEELTKVWDKIIVNRSRELSEWAEILGKVHKRKIQIYAYANNHYAGYAPATVEMFQELWRRAVKENGKSKRAAPQGQLFK
jgi:uncharacterized protein YecE (DUF72 family)